MGRQRPPRTTWTGWTVQTTVGGGGGAGGACHWPRLACTVTEKRTNQLGTYCSSLKSHITIQKGFTKLPLLPFKSDAILN